MNKLRCYLTRRYNGLYLLTALKPYVTTVIGTDHEDAYIKYGDPVGYINLTPYALISLFEYLPKERVKSFRVRLYGSTEPPYNHTIKRYDGLFRIYSYKHQNDYVGNVCSWFVEKMFNIENVDNFSGVDVNFYGEYL